jgi:hypothetical protein
MLLKLNEQEARQELSEVSVHIPYHRHRGRLSGNERPRSPLERINAARGYKAYAPSLPRYSSNIAEKNGSWEEDVDFTI